jgi:diphosphomevalonate decarboxylase
VEWNPESGVTEVDGAGHDYVDFVILLESSVKAVSSSEAHQRVKTSPRFEGRASRAESRLERVKSALLHGNHEVLTKVVFEEAMDMHELFHTSEPPFSYWNSDSKIWIEKVKSNSPELPSKNCILTMDAGANVHLFVPANEADQWDAFLGSQGPRVSYLKSNAGKGACYDVDPSL